MLNPLFNQLRRALKRQRIDHVRATVFKNPLIDQRILKTRLGEKPKLGFLGNIQLLQ